jgi:hypothetical protein
MYSMNSIEKGCGAVIVEKGSRIELEARTCATPTDLLASHT